MQWCEGQAVVPVVKGRTGVNDCGAVDYFLVSKITYYFVRIFRLDARTAVIGKTEPCPFSRQEGITNSNSRSLFTIFLGNLIRRGQRGRCMSRKGVL
jgi:hypothetical protein